MGGMMRLLRKCGAGERRDNAKNRQKQHRPKGFHICILLIQYHSVNNTTTYHLVLDFNDHYCRFSRSLVWFPRR
jgi:hypothetical protein